MAQAHCRPPPSDACKSVYSTAQTIRLVIAMHIYAVITRNYSVITEKEVLTWWGNSMWKTAVFIWEKMLWLR